MMNEILVVLGGIAATVAIIGGGYRAYHAIRSGILSRPYKERFLMFAGTNDLRDQLLKLRGKTINFHTVLDFTSGTALSFRIIQETEYRKLLCGDGKNLNGERLPLYRLSDNGELRSFASVIVRVKDSDRLRFGACTRPSAV